ncbi:MAG TPA: hypothetical protein VKA15_17020 [Isosphaeraceae bacterium]|nr:hypothetical protein [Isosphaeraceae bacterium]
MSTVPVPVAPLSTASQVHPAAQVSAMPSQPAPQVLRANTDLYINTAHTLVSEFMAGAVIDFNPGGSVLSGSLAIESFEYTNTAHTEGSWYLAGTPLTFRPDGSVL